jgi:hypothetical protein
MQASDREVLDRLATVSKDEISHIYFAEGAICSEIVKLCSDINFVIELFIGHSQSSLDLSDPACLIFLKATLPALVEVFLRRKTLRYVICDCLMSIDIYTSYHHIYS